eukprot:746772-Hanusia_phi.AAC.5
MPAGQPQRTPAKSRSSADCRQHVTATSRTDRFSLGLLYFPLRPAPGRKLELQQADTTLDLQELDRKPDVRGELSFHALRWDADGKICESTLTLQRERGRETQRNADEDVPRLDAFLGYEAKIASPRILTSVMRGVHSTNCDGKTPASW